MSTREEWIERALDAAEAQGFSRLLDDDDACAFVVAILLAPHATPARGTNPSRSQIVAAAVPVESTARAG